MMKNKIWLMEGLSSQRDLIQGIKYFALKMQAELTIYASHRYERNEILSTADFSFIEPCTPEERMPFIYHKVEKYGIDAIHAGRDCLWFENHRMDIESSGASLSTGALGQQWLESADDKVTFSEVMEANQLAVVPSLRINSFEELQNHLDHSPFEGQQLCVKPVKGIYGMGFWRFDGSASSMSIFNHPENRIVHPQQYLTALSVEAQFNALVLMPYLPGPEYSVDILADNGEVLAAIARRKDGPLQYLENSGKAFELACSCASTLKADGLVNVQVRNDISGAPVLLEANMRPSGGIGNTFNSGVNLPGLFAFHKLGLMSKSEVINMAKNDFKSVTVRSITGAIDYPPSLINRLN